MEIEQVHYDYQHRVVTSFQMSMQYLCFTPLLSIFTLLFICLFIFATYLKSTVMASMLGFRLE